jgi:hypothetical protein
LRRTHIFLALPSPPKRTIERQAVHVPHSAARHATHSPHLSFLFERAFGGGAEGPAAAEAAAAAAAAASVAAVAAAAVAAAAAGAAAVDRSVGRLIPRATQRSKHSRAVRPGKWVASNT